jgi:hypothetical protein
VPKFSLVTLAALVPSVGTIILQIELPRRSGTVGTRLGSTARAARGARPSHEKAKAMQIPSILQGESRTRLIQGMVIGAVASMVIGFSWGGWVTGGTANKLAAEQAGNAVVAVLTPLCVAKFLQDGDAKANLAVLQKISTSWEQGQYLEKGGWATRPGAASPDYELARACAAKLIGAKAASQ